MCHVARTFKLLAWVDENVIDGIVDWYEIDRPELGTVELGGRNSSAVFRNPPGHLLEAFADHGVLERTIDADRDSAHKTWAALASVGIDMDEVSEKLEREGVPADQRSAARRE